MTKISDNIVNAAAALPVYVFISSLLEGIIFQDNRGLVFFIVLVINSIVNLILKALLWKNTPNTERPKDGPELACGDKYGMPSGHSQFVWCFAIFWILYISYSKIFVNKVANVLSILCLLFIAIIVSQSRIFIKCHTRYQVIVGALIGSIVAIILFYITKKMLMKN